MVMVPIKSEEEVGMGKAKVPRQLKDNEAKAVTRTIRVSPQKLNLVAEMIRGKRVNVALADLTFSRKRIAATVKKRLNQRLQTQRIIMILTLIRLL